MSWTAVLVIAAGAFGFKVAGTFGLGRLVDTPTGRAVGVLLVPALLASLVVVQTFGDDDGGLTVDARLAGVAAGAVAAWRRAPFWAVVLIAAVVTAGLRALTPA